jgi:hypothetical protein
MSKMSMQKLEAAGAAVLAALIGYGAMHILHGVGDSTAAMVGAAVAVAGWYEVMNRQGKA